MHTWSRSLTKRWLNLQTHVYVRVASIVLKCSTGWPRNEWQWDHLSIYQWRQGRCPKSGQTDLWVLRSLPREVAGELLHLSLANTSGSKLQWYWWGCNSTNAFRSSSTLIKSKPLLLKSDIDARTTSSLARVRDRSRKEETDSELPSMHLNHFPTFLDRLRPCRAVT